MKISVSPHTVAFSILAAVSPLAAQNLASSYPSIEAHSPGIESMQGSDDRGFADITTPSGKYDLPVAKKAVANLSSGAPVIATQDSLTLDIRRAPRDVGTVIDLKLLREPSAYRKVLVSHKGKPYEITPGSLETGLAEISAVYRESGKRSASSECPTIALTVEQRVKMDPARVLEVVETEVAANPGCACEIVKTAIRVIEADSTLVVDIAEVAITSAPENMRIISQCAIAQVPESLAGVQALLAKLDPNSGEVGYSSKSSKSGKETLDAKSAKAAFIVSEPPNPLDLPPALPPLTPPPLYPTPVTDVDA